MALTIRAWFEQRFHTLRSWARPHAAREWAAPTTPTSLVGRAFERMNNQDGALYSTTQFGRNFHTLLRYMLRDDAKRRRAIRRGGQLRMVPMESEPVDEAALSLLAMDVKRALAALDKRRPEHARVLGLHLDDYTRAEIAQALHCSQSKVDKHLAYAQAYVVLHVAERNPVRH